MLLVDQGVNFKLWEFQDFRISGSVCKICHSGVSTEFVMASICFEFQSLVGEIWSKEYIGVFLFTNFSHRQVT